SAGTGSIGTPSVTSPGVFVAILPHMEQGALYTTIWNGTTGTYNGTITATSGNINTPMVGPYLCPARRHTASIVSAGAGPRTDFPFTRNGQLNSGGLSNNHAILSTRGVTLSTVTSAAGSSNTLLLSHKIMKTGNYLSTNGDPNGGTAKVG